MIRTHRSLRCIRNLKSRTWVSTSNRLDELEIKEMNITSHGQDTVIKVNAVSLNPIDQWMINGRGATMSSIFTKFKNRTSTSQNFVTPGRDFHGTVVSCNNNKLHAGQNVVGVKHPLDKNGALAEYINASSMVFFDSYSI